jgi:hypothetical protein
MTQQSFRFLRGALLALAAPIALSAAPGHAATQPAAGTYSMLAYVAGVAGPAKANCDYKVGDNWTDYFVYPGPGKVGATKTKQIQDSAHHYMSIDTYPKTPAAGVTAWSGTYDYVYLPGGSSGTGKFTWKFTFINANAFVLSRTFTSDVPGGTCTIRVDESAIRTGD